MRALLALLCAACVCEGALDPVAVRNAAQYSAAHRGVTLLVVDHGQTLAEQSGNLSQRIYSGTKAFWGFAALAAAEDGLLRLDERVAETIGDWQHDARKSRITIRQLLDFSGGIAPANFLHSDDPGNRDALALGQPIVAEPGSAFIYGPAALQVFHAVLKRKLHGETPEHYLERRVLRRIGLGSQRYLKDSAGNSLLAAGWELTPRQWSRLAQLVLAGGAPVISSASLAECWRGSAANPAYSLGWWNNRMAPAGREIGIETALHPRWQQQSWRGICICRSAPNDLVMCVGSGNQRLYVIPSLGVIVVRHGNGGSFSDAEFLRLLLGQRA